MPDADLREVTPDTAIQDWLTTERAEKSDETVKNYRSLANRWREFCEEKDIDSMLAVSGKTLMRFKQWRLEDEVTLSTVGQQLTCLRAFIKHCEQIEAVKSGLLDKVPEARAPDKTRDEKIDRDTAESILSYFQKFEYASRRNAVFALIWHSAFRTGTVQAIDLKDCYFEGEHGYIGLSHRPEQDTPLKNAENAQREVNLSDDVTEILSDYVEHNRMDTTDDYGREPLFTTSAGRVTKNTIRRDLYSATRPCEYAHDCPHGRDPELCDAASNKDLARQCPSSTTGHPIRRGSITHAHLDNDVPKRVISDRCDVSVEVLEEHYDRQDEETKREIREGYLENM